jgi:hypothetical protein
LRPTPALYQRELRAREDLKRIGDIQGLTVGSFMNPDIEVNAKAKKKGGKRKYRITG